MTDFILIMHVAESSKSSQMIFWCKLQNPTKVNGAIYLQRPNILQAIFFSDDTEKNSNVNNLYLL